MQGHNWNDLRYALALHRAGTLAAAGRMLGANETTVARRLRALERALGAPLFVRGGAGRHEATEAGRTAISAAERVERENIVLGDVMGRVAGLLSGSVRITSVPMLVNRVLVPRLGAFRAAHPGVTVELVPEARNLSLSRREADLALRLARPEAGGLGTRAQKLGALGFAAYGPAEAEAAEWIGYDEAHAHLPQARWLAAVGADGSGLRVADAETALEAVAAGLGRTLLPRILGDADARLRRLDIADGRPEREVWLLSHAEDAGRGAIAAAKAWLRSVDWAGRGGAG